MMIEKHTYRDRDSQVEVTQLTDYRGHSHHFYFTNPGWYAGGRKLLFGSDRNNLTNLYGVDLESGEIEQLTELAPVPLPRELEFVRACKNPQREEAYFFHDLSLLALDLETRQTRVLYETEPGWCVSQLNCSADGERMYFGDYEDMSSRFPVDLLRGYVGFRETWEAKPLSRVVEVSVDGSGSRVVFEERYWIGHVNTSPIQPYLLTFCHEGPWHLVDNRIWGLDARSGNAWKIRPTGPGEIVGHEYWYANGEWIGYHGQKAAGQEASGERPGGDFFLGRIHYDGTRQVESAFPGHTGHIFSNDENLIVGDGGKLIRVWQWDDQRQRYRGPRLLCRHDSSMHIQQTHPHPRISPGGDYLVFTSDRTGYGNVYTVPLVDFELLPEIEQGR